jgi:hypothetical protein
MRVPTKVLGIIAILCAAVVTPVSAKHHGRTHDHWHYRAPNTRQYAPYAVSHALDRIDPSRPGGLARRLPHARNDLAASGYVLTPRREMFSQPFRTAGLSWRALVPRPKRLNGTKITVPSYA